MRGILTLLVGFFVIIFSITPFTAVSALVEVGSTSGDNSTAADADLHGGLIPGASPITPGSSPTPNPTGNSSTTTEEEGSTGGCEFDSSMTVSEMIKGCKPSRGQISTDDEDYTFNGGAKQRVIQLINNIIAVGSLLAVGAIVYAAILYTIAAGDDERIKSAKNALKFGIIGFVAMLLSFPLVNALVNLFYTTSG